MDLFDFDNNRVSVTLTLNFIIIEYDNNFTLQSYTCIIHRQN